MLDSYLYVPVCKINSILQRWFIRFSFFNHYKLMDLDLFVTFSLLWLLLLKLNLFHLKQIEGSTNCFPIPFGTVSIVFDSFFADWSDSVLLAHVVPLLPQTWNLRFLQTVLVSFTEKWYFKTIVWVLGMFTATRLFIVS